MSDPENIQNGEPNEEELEPIIPEPSPEFERVADLENEDTHMPETDEIKSDPKEIPTTIPLTTNEERTWAMLAHMSVLLNLVTGFLGGFAALVIYFIYKDRSRFVAYHAMQAFIFQSITWIGAGIIAAILITLGTVLAFLIVPLLCLIPGFLSLLLIPASLIYGTIGGIQVSNGEDFRYWQVGDWVRDILHPKPVSRA